MPMDWQTLPLALVRGVDTRSDPKTVAAPNLLRCENGVFTTPGSIRKRNGYAALAAPSGVDQAGLLFSLGSQMIQGDSEALYSYSPTESRWETIGPWSPMTAAPRRVIDIAEDMWTADRATVGNLSVLVWQWNDGTAFRIGWAVVDETTGGYVVQPQQLSTDAIGPRVTAVGTSFVVTWVKVTTTALLSWSLTAASFASGTPSPSPTTLVSDVGGVYDVCAASTVAAGAPGALVVYNSSTTNTIKFGALTAAGALSGTWHSQATVANAAVISCAYIDDGVHSIKIGLAWGTTAHNVYAALYSNLFAVSVAAALIGSSGATLNNLTAAFYPDAGSGLNTLKVLWEVDGASNYYNEIETNTLDVGGTVGTQATFRRHAGLVSRLFSSDGRLHVVVAVDTALQSCYAVIRVTDGLVCAYLAPDTAGGVTVQPQLGNVQDLGGGAFGWAGLKRTRVSANGQALARQLQDWRITLGAVTSKQVANVSGEAFIAAGLLWRCDGASIAENGFLIYPEGITGVPSSHGGALVVGATYSFRAYHEWTAPGTGERQRSTTATSLPVTITDGNDSVTLTLPTLSLTNKTNVNIVVFRTLANGTIFYRTSSPDPTDFVAPAGGYVLNDPTADTVTFVDKRDDLGISSQEIDENDVALDAVAPPSCSLIAQGNNRVFLSGFEDPSLVWFSLLRGFGEGLAFNDGLTVELTSGEGPITGLATTADTLIVFRASAIYAVAGDGPDNTGQTGTYATPRTLADDIGCTAGASIVRIPSGVMFMSARGIYLVGNDLSLTYVGAPVEAFNGETIVAANLLTSVYEVRFLTASGKALVYNYLAGQWSVFLGLTGALDACMWRGVYSYLIDATGVVRTETAGAFLDVATAITLRLETAWIHGQAGLQTFQRVRRALFLGALKGDHKPHVSVWYDYDDVSSPTVYEWANAETAPGAYQFQIRLARQKCAAIKLRVEDVADGAVAIGESYSLSEITLEIGVRTGADRLPAVNSV